MPYEILDDEPAPKKGRYEILDDEPPLEPPPLLKRPEPAERAATNIAKAAAPPSDSILDTVKRVARDAATEFVPGGLPDVSLPGVPDSVKGLASSIAAPYKSMAQTIGKVPSQAKAFIDSISEGLGAPTQLPGGRVRADRPLYAGAGIQEIPHETYQKTEVAGIPYPSVPFLGAHTQLPTKPVRPGVPLYAGDPVVDETPTVKDARPALWDAVDPVKRALAGVKHYVTEPTIADPLLEDTERMGGVVQDMGYRRAGNVVKGAGRAAAGFMSDPLLLGATALGASAPRLFNTAMEGVGVMTGVPAAAQFAEDVPDALERYKKATPEERDAIEQNLVESGLGALAAAPGVWHAGKKMGAGVSRAEAALGERLWPAASATPAAPVKAALEGPPRPLPTEFRPDAWPVDIGPNINNIDASWNARDLPRTAAWAPERVSPAAIGQDASTAAWLERGRQAPAATAAPRRDYIGEFIKELFGEPKAAQAPPASPLPEDPFAQIPENRQQRPLLDYGQPQQDRFGRAPWANLLPGGWKNEPPPITPELAKIIERIKKPSQTWDRELPGTVDDALKYPRPTPPDSPEGLLPPLGDFLAERAKRQRAQVPVEAVAPPVAEPPSAGAAEPSGSVGGGPGPLDDVAPPVLSQGGDGGAAPGVTTPPVEPLVPEKPETLALQVQELKQRTRKAVMLPLGTDTVALARAVPGGLTGLTKVEVKHGDSPALWLIEKGRKDGLTPTQVQTLAGRMGGRAALLDKPPKPAPGEPQAVVATRTPEGTEVEATVVSPENAPAVAEQQQAKAAPEDAVGLEAPGETLAARTSAPEADWTATQAANAARRQAAADAKAAQAAELQALPPEIRDAIKKQLEIIDKVDQKVLLYRGAPGQEIKQAALAEIENLKARAKAAQLEVDEAAAPEKKKSDVEAPTETATAPTTHKFSSTQVDLPQALAEKTRRLAASIPDDALADGGREARPHITVKYGLHTNDVSEVERVLAGEPPAKVKLGATSIFQPSEGSGGADVVKIDVHSPDLHRLNDRIASATATTDTHPEYRPHVTLAYVKAGEGKKFSGDKTLAGQEAVLDTVTFTTQDGAEHQVKLGQRPVPWETTPPQPPPTEAVTAPREAPSTGTRQPAPTQPVQQAEGGGAPPVAPPPPVIAPPQKVRTITLTSGKRRAVVTNDPSAPPSAQWQAQVFDAGSSSPTSMTDHATREAALDHARGRLGGKAISEEWGYTQAPAPQSPPVIDVKATPPSAPAAASPPATPPSTPPRPSDTIGPSGIRMEDIAAASQRLGITMPDPKTFRETHEQVAARAERDFVRISRALKQKDVELNPNLTRDEAYVGATEFYRMTDEVMPRLMQELEDATTSGDAAAIKTARNRIDGQLLDIDRLGQQLFRGGSEAGRRLAYQQTLIGDDLDAATAIRKGQTLMGGKLPVETQKLIVETAAQAKRVRDGIIKRVMDRAAEAQERISKMTDEQRAALKDFKPERIKGCKLE